MRVIVIFAVMMIGAIIVDLSDQYYKLKGIEKPYVE